MQQKLIKLFAVALLVQVALPGAFCQTPAHTEKAPYPAMAPLEQYLMPDANSEIALARSAAPASISDGAEVMVLGPKGYTTAVKGTNGFLCLVERAWGDGTDRSGVLESQGAGPALFQSGSRKDLCADLPDENETGAGGKIEGRDPGGDRIGAG